jgi:hypothetical protein
MVKKRMAALALRINSWPVTRYCLFAGSVGLALVVGGVCFVGGTGWGKDLFPPGATMMTVALTAYVATKGVVTWAEQRRRDRDAAEYKHREGVYEEIVVFMLAQFVGGNYDFVKDAGLRAKAALWASPEVIQSLSDWQSMLSTIQRTRAKNSDGSTSLLPLEQKMIKALFGAAVLAMRNDLAPDNTERLKDVDTILDSMFNDD